jgi:predicted phosphate transport protein (TIGR00153 family)
MTQSEYSIAVDDAGSKYVGSYISKIFGASPVAPIQEHMEICYKAAKELIVFFEAVNSADWEKVTVSRERIVELENEADDAKKQIRMQLSQALFMPVARGDLLDLVLVQDKIPNLARDISGVVIGRRMQIPQELQPQFIAFVERNVDAAKGARKTIRELDELYETGFRGAEADLVARLIGQLDRIENDTDEQQVGLRKILFELEKSLPPVDVMFLYRVIESIGDIGDMAERIGRRLELLMNH